MEFPFDLSIIWLSLLLSVMYIMIFVVKTGILPAIKKHQFLKQQLSYVTSKITPVIVIFDRFTLVFRKVPRKEIESEGVDEDQQNFLFKLECFYPRGGNYSWEKYFICSHPLIQKKSPCLRC